MVWNLILIGGRLNVKKIFLKKNVILIIFLVYYFIILSFLFFLLDSNIILNSFFGLKLLRSLIAF